MVKKHNYEQQEQIAVANYIRIFYPKLLWTISISGINLNIIKGSIAKNMGYSKGTPDISVYFPTVKYHGLFIELKKSKIYGSASLTPEQITWIDTLNKLGYYAVVCYGFKEAKNVIDNYIKGVLI